MNWYLRQGTKPVGPVEEASLAELLVTGQVAPRELLWKDGVNEWRPALEWNEFRALKVPAYQEVSSVAEDEKVWVVLETMTDGRSKTTGPWALQEIRQALCEGRLQESDSLWKKGMTGWARLDTRPEGLSAPVRENLSQP